MKTRGTYVMYGYGVYPYPLRVRERRVRVRCGLARTVLYPCRSLRIGATLEYLLRGVPFEAMKGIGRRSSDSFSKYLRKHAQILAPYVQANPDLHQKISHEQMSVIR
jgi:hypothetical protein